MKARIGIAFMVVALFLGTAAMAGVNTGFLNSGIEKNTEARQFFVDAAMPEVKDGGTYVSIDFGGGTNYLMEPSYPVMPYKSKVLTFPFGTKIDGIDVKVGNVQTMSLNKKIAPAPEATPLNGAEPKAAKEGAIYKSSTPYPSSWVEWNTGAGLKNGKHVVFLSIRAFPARYIPASNEIEYVDNISIDVKYTPSAKPLVKNDVYDLLIVAPSEFKDALQPLVDHKNSHGMKTIMVTLDEIYNSNYFPVQGRDGAEKIKYFIKDSIENWGIKYVMLVGGKKSYVTGNWGYDGATKVDDSLWWVPVRYAALATMGKEGEGGYLSDLYFADIYDANGSFSSWDTNGDGVYAAWSFRYGKDTIDGYPDVYVGRLACRSVKEVKTVVNKIITYESTPADPSWFNKMLLVGGDTFPGDSAGVYDGEYATTHEFSFMPSKFTATKLYASDGSIMGGKSGKMAARLAWMNVIKTMNSGFGFVAFDGHGSPTAWATHPVGDANIWVNGLMTYNMDLLHNGGKLPVVSVGGCHNSEFNISLMDFQNNKWTYQPTYECWSWHLVKMAGGGSIATIGYAGLGLGTTGDSNKDGIPDCVEYLGGYIESRFFNAYGHDGKDILGEAFGQAETDYASAFPPLDNQGDCKTLEEWTLLGDPSLKIGGYS